MRSTTYLGLQSQTTRLVKSHTSIEMQAGTHTGFSPSLTPCSKELTPTTCTPVTNDPKTTSRRTIMLSDFKFELCPLHSPLLRASLLVSFPPVNNMLKSTG